MSDYVDLLGASGRTYRYWILDPARDIIRDEPGNYGFVLVLNDGRAVPAYLGETNSLSTRLPTHEKRSAAYLLGATRVVAHTTPAGASARHAEEADLIAYYNPPLNQQLRTLG